MKCEFEDCKTGEEASEVLRLTSFHGYWQNPMRLLMTSHPSPLT